MATGRLVKAHVRQIPRTSQRHNANGPLLTACGA
jgi:hypothetical protein